MVSLTQPEKHWYVELSMQGYKTKAIAKPAPVHKEYLADLVRSVIGCRTLEATQWRMSNHEHGDLWLDEEGKLSAREIHGAVTETMHSNRAMDVLRGPLVFTGGADDDGWNNYLDKATAETLADSLNKRRPIQVMDGFYFLPK